MISLSPDKAGLKILCLGAHCDDIEIGCGGTLLQLIRNQRISELYWVVFTSTPERATEAIDSAEFFTDGVENRTILVKDFRDGVLPQQSLEVKAHFEQIKSAFNPDVIFTHYRNDLHQDHRLVNQMTWNTFRNHLVLEYEIQKYDGDLGNPNMYVSIDSETARVKVNALMEFFGSQSNKHWFDEETFYSLMRIRGLESVSRFSEAFYSRKAVLA